MSWRTELVEAGRQSWLAARANEYREVPPKQRCPLVNPLCPDDLCVLEAGHPGTAQGYHILGTDPYDAPYRYIKPRSVFTMMEPGTPDEDLMREGWRLQQQHFPEDRH